MNDRAYKRWYHLKADKNPLFQLLKLICSETAFPHNKSYDHESNTCSDRLF
jgi:hypothetical protein